MEELISKDFKIFDCSYIKQWIFALILTPSAVTITLHGSLAGGLLSKHDAQVNHFYLARLIFESAASSVGGSAFKAGGFDVSFAFLVFRCQITTLPMLKERGEFLNQTRSKKQSALLKKWFGNKLTILV